jgi:hypothetical protein
MPPESWPLVYSEQRSTAVVVGPSRCFYRSELSPVILLSKAGRHDRHRYTALGSYSSRLHAVRPYALRMIGSMLR